MLIKPIFIICLHRSGSTLLKNILGNNSDVAMVTDEMHISDPFFKTFDQQFRRFGDLNNDSNLIKLVNFIFSGNIRGSFWKDYRKLDISKENLFVNISKTNGSLKSIISVLLKLYLDRERKKRIGVKYPLHHSRIKLIKEWFPESKYIYLSRDIRAICCSQLNGKDTLRRKKKFRQFGFIVHYFSLFYFLFDYIWFVRCYNTESSNNDVCHVRFEDLITNPREKVKHICDFCEIEFEEKMLLSTGKSSSYTDKINNIGLDVSRLQKWKSELSKIDKFIIDIISKDYMRKIGYKNIDKEYNDCK